MRVLVPATREPLYKAGVTVFIDSTDDESYWRFWSDLWAVGESVIVVEHDIVPSGDALAELVTCDGDWCAQPYPYFVGAYHGLGCVKFTSELMRQTPNLWERVAGMSDPGHPPKHWCRLDGWSQQVLNQSGLVMCRHQTLVGHGNSDKPSHGCA